MSSWLIILSIILVITALGSGVVLQFLPPRKWLTTKGLFAAVTIGVVLGGWSALILAELDTFSLPWLVVIWLAGFLILIGLLVIRIVRNGLPLIDEQSGGHPDRRQRSFPERIFAVVMVLWLGVISWLYFRPHEYILGGADAGVYVSLGAEIAQNGGFLLQDETLAALDPALKEVVLRPLPTNSVASSYLFPGFYVVDESAGVIVPQFYPLHPVWQAVAFSLSSAAVEGVIAELLMTGLWMMLASVAIVLVARELGGWRAAFIMMLALTVAALQVWFARYPTTESLTQFLLWSGLWAMMRWLGGKQPASLWAMVSGLALGAMFMVRIDVIILLPIFVLVLVDLWFRGWQQADWWFAAPFVLLIVHAFVHGAVFSKPYFSEHVGYGFGLLWSNWWILVLGAAIGVASLWVLYVQTKKNQSLEQVRLPAIIFLIGAFLSYAIYGWFIRPIIGEPLLQPDTYSESLLLMTNHENWRRLGWYLSTPGVWLGIAGICFLLWRLERKTAVLVAAGMAFSVLYLWNVRANPHQIYVMRRYVPVVSPFFMLAAAVLISKISTRFDMPEGKDPRRRYAGLVIAALLGLLWLAGMSWSARGLISQVDNQDVVEQLALIERDMPSNSVLLFNDQAPVGQGDFWGTPLKFIFGHDAFAIRDLEMLRQAPLAEAVESWQFDGRTVIWIGDPQWLSDQGFSFNTTTRDISSHQLEGSYEHKPVQVNAVNWKFPMSFIDRVPTNGR